MIDKKNCSVAGRYKLTISIMNQLTSHYLISNQYPPTHGADTAKSVRKRDTPNRGYIKGISFLYRNLLSNDIWVDQPEGISDKYSPPCTAQMLLSATLLA